LRRISKTISNVKEEIKTTTNKTHKTHKKKKILNYKGIKENQQ